MHRLLVPFVVGSVLALVACGSTGASSVSTTSSSTARFASGLELSQCMRSHGVPNFPDPSSAGDINLDSASGINPASPAFQTAQEACKAYLPHKGSIPAMSASERARAFAFARCMRSRGQQDFPDPTIGGPTANTTGRVLALRGMFFALGPNFNPKTPGFRQAAAACGVRPPGS